MKLSRKEKAQVYKAAERIERDAEWHSCNALYFVSGTMFLAKKYAAFYGKDHINSWFIDRIANEEDGIDAINWRVLLLLLFAEAWEGE